MTSSLFEHLLIDSNIHISFQKIVKYSIYICVNVGLLSTERQESDDLSLMATVLCKL